MSGISKYTYATLTTAIRDYTEVDDNVLTQAIIDGIIMAAENRIFYDVPMDSDRFVQEGTLSANNNSINAPAGALFIRGIEVFDSTTATTGPGQWLEKKDQTYLTSLEYIIIKWQLVWDQEAMVTLILVLALTSRKAYYMPV